MYTQNVTTDKEREMRKKDLEEQDRYVSEKHTQKQKNQNFTQVYPLGWKRLRELSEETREPQSFIRCLRRTSMALVVLLLLIKAT